MHTAPSKLYSLTSPWAFTVQGIDIMGKVTSKALIGNQYRVMAIDYYTKWVEAASYTKLEAEDVAKFIE